MQIKNLMSENLITIDKDQNLSDALKLLRKHNISRLPVTNNKELVGIVSERDIANKLGSSKSEGMPASRFHISSVMVKDVITVLETMQLGDVAELMLENGIGSVPVVSGEGMIGIVSKADFVTLAVGIAFDKITVKEIMTGDVVAVSPTDRLIHARRLMIDAHIGRVPVIEEDELKGIITSKDLMRAFIDFRKNVPEKHQKSQIKEVLVEDIMSSNPSSVSKKMSISDVSKIMIETGFNGLPVVEDGKVIGIITQTDILRLIAKLES
ncbi:CBS domain-containing protein [Methanobrevibacter gottschalkii]|uniref:CBS domain protein n=2 Tax=Methanobrevibacter gottschalkii TaxID=190974 RepID=A0A3N5BZU4_9EURY|nr:MULTISPECIES: CBS domain-containing protein [Methanobrevibacter]MCQ2970170.1 CBS domain-containing protein [archaeon]OEC93815.1 inosine-5-monophosphate dehydrogenase [Methanobrevibacter sp. A27]RPF52652.1 CBS domain protein [Methanobrevibacter gottschalkii DSM 11977]SEK29348.1 CBS domain-containing protein [Methanobrevibacter gottschalkii]